MSDDIFDPRIRRQLATLLGSAARPVDAPVAPLLTNIDTADDIFVRRSHAGLSAQTLTFAALFSRGGPYVATILAHVLALGLTILTLKLAAERFDATAFGEFLVSRRAVTVLAFPLLLGLGLGLPRYVAIAGGSPAASAKSASYFFAAMAITVVVVPAFVLISLAFKAELAQAFFGDSARRELIPPTALIVVGLYLHTVVFAYLMGHLAVLPANLLQVVNTGAIPAVAVVMSADAITALGILGVATTVTSLVAVAFTLRRALLARSEIDLVKVAVRELLRFGVPRVPGEFAIFALFAIPTFVVAHRFDIETAGYFSFGLSLVQLLTTPFGAVNAVLLPTVSSLVARGEWRRISGFMNRFVLAAVLVAAGGVAATELFVSSPARSLLGPGLIPAMDASRLLLIAAIPYVAYAVMRGAVDAVSPWPYNSINVIGAVCLVSALLVVWSSYDAAQIAVVVGLIALGLSTVGSFLRALRRAESGAATDRSAVLPEATEGTPGRAHASAVLAGEPLVSIVTPTYQQARFIGECIESVLAQTYTNWEQIVIDDGSVDDTAAVVRRYDDPRIRYVRQDHVGILSLADTYNRALALARGEVISILEGDDIWTRDKLERLLPKLADPEVVLAYGRTMLLVGATLYPTKSIPGPWFVRKFGVGTLYNRPVGAAGIAMLHGDVGSFTFPCAVVIRRSAIQAIGGFQYVKDLGAVDFPTFVTLSLRGRFEYVDRVVAYWRRYPGAASWLRHEQQLLANHRFAQAFMREHASALGLGPEGLREIEDGWGRHLKRAAFNSGRSLLLDRQWEQAREQFRHALRSPDPIVVAAAFMGCAASLLRRDIEGFMHAVGIVSFPGKRRGPESQGG